MRKLFLLLALASVSFAQTTSQPSSLPAAPSAGEQKTATNNESNVPPNTVVITIPGSCAKPAIGADCKTEVTRSEFEQLANALSVPEERRTDLAKAYAQGLALANAAEKQGIANSPQTQEIMKFVRLQTLARLLAQHVQEQAANISPADQQNYYDQHKEQFTQATLERIFIPKNPPAAKEKPSEAAVKAEAAKMEQAAKAPNADFAKLQKQVYDDLKIAPMSLPAELQAMRREMLPAGQQKVFDMAPGSVSDAIDEPSGVYIYKLVSKETAPLTQVQTEIKRAVEQQRFQDDMEKILATAKPELNPAYFGAATKPPTLGAPTPGAPVKQGPVTPGSAPASKVPAPAPKSPSNTPK